MPFSWTTLKGFKRDNIGNKDRCYKAPAEVQERKRKPEEAGTDSRNLLPQHKYLFILLLLTKVAVASLKDSPSGTYLLAFMVLPTLY